MENLQLIIAVAAVIVALLVPWWYSRKHLVVTATIDPAEGYNRLVLSIGCKGRGDSGIIPSAYWVEHAKPTSADDASIRLRLKRPKAIEINREGKEYKPGAPPYVECLPVDVTAGPILGVWVFDGSLERKWKMKQKALKKLNEDLLGRV